MESMRFIKADHFVDFYEFFYSMEQCLRRSKQAEHCQKKIQKYVYFYFMIERQVKNMTVSHQNLLSQSVTDYFY
jgi:hypothetical protein